VASDNSGLSCENAEKSRILASLLFLDEQWIYREPGIWVARSRLAEEYKEPDKWKREVSQVRILTGRGSAAYFLPEKKNEDKGKIYADTVIDGEVTELKTVSGNRSTLGTDFKQGYKQGAALAGGRIGIEKHSVYIRLLSDISPGSVMAKIAGELKNRPDKGNFICYFEVSGMLCRWSYEELRGIIGTGQKNHPAPQAKPGSAGRDSVISVDRHQPSHL
jgi:hypothetical protein